MKQGTRTFFGGTSSALFVLRESIPLDPGVCGAVGAGRKKGKYALNPAVWQNKANRIRGKFFRFMYPGKIRTKYSTRPLLTNKAQKAFLRKLTACQPLKCCTLAHEMSLYGDHLSQLKLKAAGRIVAIKRATRPVLVQSNAHAPINS